MVKCADEVARYTLGILLSSWKMMSGKFLAVQALAVVIFAVYTKVCVLCTSAVVFGFIYSYKK
jgi:hypothetical protein